MRRARGLSSRKAAHLSARDADPDQANAIALAHPCAGNRHTNQTHVILIHCTLAKPRREALQGFGEHFSIPLLADFMPWVGIGHPQCMLVHTRGKSAT